MADVVHLVIEDGAAKGRQITVPPAGMRLGRAPKNDLVLDDPLLSRHHCRFFLKPGQGLWISDLGSINQTLVNGAPVQEVQLRAGDRVVIGGTVIRVVSDAPSAGPGPRSPLIDLGLTATRAEPIRPRFNRGMLFATLAVVAVAAVVIWAPRALRNAARPLRPVAAATETKPDLEITYEKVQADTNGIFRYRLAIAKDRTLSIQVDDTGQTHFQNSKEVSADLLQRLAGFVRDAGFFTLDDEYAGIRRPDLFEQLDLAVTIRRKTHHVRVANRVEPPAFKQVRQRIEEFGHVELGPYATQFTPEKLTEMAHTAYRLGRKMFDDREVAVANLAASIRSLTEAEFYLKTVEPKPDFYPDVLSGLAESKDELERKFKDASFLVEHAMGIKSWEEAARQLRILCELLPPSDPRSEDSRRKLLEVENRMKKKRR